jgi:hypothetical protein
MLSDQKTTLNAELANAFDGTAFFLKPGGTYVQLPLKFLAQNEIARVIEWARARDAEPAQPLMMCTGSVAKDICAQWPNRLDNGVLSDKEVVNQIITPKIFTIIMVKDMVTPYHLPDTLRAIRDVEIRLNEGDSHFMETLVLCPFKDDDMKAFQTLLRRNGGNWLMPNEWQMKDKSSIWNNYWRIPLFTVLIVDPSGTVLCDSSAKTPDDSKMQDPVEYLESLVKVADRIRAGGYSVDNPKLNAEAFQSVLASQLAQKSTMPPRPAIFDFNGMDPQDFAALGGRKFMVSMEIGTDGMVRNLQLKEGGNPQAEAAFKQASMLWQFLPAFKNGIPEAKTVVAPITIDIPKAPEPVTK